MARPTFLLLALLGPLCPLSLTGATEPLATTTATAAMASPSSPAPKYLNLTAISAKDGKSTIECWQLAKPITVSSTPGTEGTMIQQLGDVSNSSYVVLPPMFDGGLHTAPTAQYVVFLSGEARVTLPDSAEEAIIEGGENGLIIAADTADVSREGHITKYPRDTPTVALQIPLKDGKLPEHRVLHSGPCTECERIS